MSTVKAYYRREHKDAPMSLRTADDVGLLIAGLLAEPYSNSVAALYVEERINDAGVPDHELLVAINNEDKDVGALRYMGGGGNYFSTGEPKGDEIIRYYYTGSDREFPPGSELPIAVIREAVTEFLMSGGKRPESIEWVDD